ncbi:hypothetical protein OSTOST_07100, partial [Ostertagia ostertagi]
PDASDRGSSLLEDSPDVDNGSGTSPSPMEVTEYTPVPSPEPSSPALPPLPPPQPPTYPLVPRRHGCWPRTRTARTTSATLIPSASAPQQRPPHDPSGSAPPAPPPPRFPQRSPWSTTVQ